MFVLCEIYLFTYLLTYLPRTILKALTKGSIAIW